MWPAVTMFLDSLSLHREGRKMKVSPPKVKGLTHIEA